MSWRCLGPSIVLTTQRKELLISVGLLDVQYVGPYFLPYVDSQLVTTSPSTRCVLSIPVTAIGQEQEAHPVLGPYVQWLLDPKASSLGFSAGESGWSQEHHKLYELAPGFLPADCQR